MTDEQGNGRDSALIEKEAVAWFTRLNGKPSAADRRDFAAWLAASPEHETAFAQVAALWSSLDIPAELVAKEGAGDLSGPLEKIDLLRRQKRIGRTGSAIAGCLALLVAGSWLWLDRPNFIQDLGADIVTARGERRNITLADGSHVTLDADSALDIVLTARERRIRLLRGSAFFEVVHTGAPFVVEAGEGRARVLGTKFDVSMTEGSQVSVTLAEGSVKVSMPETAGQEDESGVVLKPGESVAYGAGGIGPVRAVNIEDEMAWHGGRFIFTNARLADVLAQIGRYRDGRIVILGTAIGSRRVSGNIALDDPDKALRAVQSTVGFRLTDLGRVVMIGP